MRRCQMYCIPFLKYVLVILLDFYANLKHLPDSKLECLPSSEMLFSPLRNTRGYKGSFEKHLTTLDCDQLSAGQR